MSEAPFEMNRILKLKTCRELNYCRLSQWTAFLMIIITVLCYIQCFLSIMTVLHFVWVFVYVPVCCMCLCFVSLKGFRDLEFCHEAVAWKENKQWHLEPREVSGNVLFRAMEQSVWRRQGGNTQNGDDRGAQGVILTISDGSVFRAVYVFVSPAASTQHRLRQIDPGHHHFKVSWLDLLLNKSEVDDSQGWVPIAGSI